MRIGRAVVAWKSFFQSREKRPERLPWKTIVLAWIGAFLGAAALGLAQDKLGTAMILGSFGASCLLIFAYPQSPFAQPRNVIGGHFLASLTGLVFLSLFGATWWSMALSVATGIALMLILRVPHPPAGSNLFIVMLVDAGWEFLFTPTLFGSVLLVLVAMVWHNATGKRYPTFW
ncbi:MAG: HPP family protein [Neisseria sp.]|nr:HPP family protein [Neisseria sp.]